jgi:hypothetical protein
MAAEAAIAEVMAAATRGLFLTFATRFSELSCERSNRRTTGKYELLGPSILDRRSAAALRLAENPSEESATIRYIMRRSRAGVTPLSLSHSIVKGVPRALSD